MGVQCGSGYPAPEEFVARSRRLRSEPTLHRVASGAARLGATHGGLVKEPERFSTHYQGQ
jgi:hypothetical protein